jgi:predicted CopG family antitoxin
MTADWYSFIKKDNDKLLERLEPKPSEEDFKRAIREIKKSEEFKKLYKEYFPLS